MVHDYSLEELKTQFKKLTSTSYLAVDNDYANRCIQKEKSLQCLAENSRCDSQFSYNLYTNCVVSYIEQGGKVRHASKSIDGYTFLIQKLEMMPKELQKHMLCLMIEVMKLMRDPSQQVFHPYFLFGAMLQMKVYERMMPFCTRMRIISRNAQQQPTLLLFEQCLCPELLDVLDDNLLFRMFSITGMYDPKHYPKLSFSVQCLLTKYEFKNVLEDMSDLSDKDLKEIRIVEKVAHQLPVPFKRSKKSYSYRSRIENKTTNCTYGFFKTALRKMLL